MHTEGVSTNSPAQKTPTSCIVEWQSLQCQILLRLLLINTPPSDLIARDGSPTVAKRQATLADILETNPLFGTAVPAQALSASFRWKQPRPHPTTYPTSNHDSTHSMYTARTSYARTQRVNNPAHGTHGRAVLCAPPPFTRCSVRHQRSAAPSRTSRTFTWWPPWLRLRAPAPPRRTVGEGKGE